MKIPLPSIRHTIHQILVGTTATVIGTIVALLIWQAIESRQLHTELEQSQVADQSQSS